MSVFTFQDLPEHFEDNIKTWMDNFLQLLSADNKLLKTEVCVAQQKCCCSFTQACILQMLKGVRTCAQNLKQNEAQSACTESTIKGVN